MKINKNLKECKDKFLKKVKSKDSWKKGSIKTLKIFTANKIVLILFLFLIIVNINYPILTWINIKNNFAQYAPYGIVAIGMTFVIITGGIDLSVGSIIAAGAMNTGIMIHSGTNTNLAIFVSVLIGLAIGISQGLLVGYFKMAPFIVTLGGLLLYRGLAKLKLNPPVQAGYINAKGGIDNSSVLEWWNKTEFLGLSVQLWALILIAIIGFFILKFTIYGRHIYAIGGNRNAARLSGVNTKLVEASVYGITGVLAAFASTILLAKVPTASSDLANGWELDIIAMVVVGGTSLSGGKGNIIGTMIGWIILSVLLNALLLMGLSAAYQKIFSGIIIIAAVLTDTSSKAIKIKMHKLFIMSKKIIKGEEKIPKPDFSRIINRFKKR